MTMDKMIALLEQKRFEIQTELDGLKTQPERNRLGQFATPPALAEDILAYAKTLLPQGEPVRFLDPAIGTGAFYSALLKVFSASRIKEASGFEIDAHYGGPAARLWGNAGLRLELADFTRQKPPAKGFNLLICNPPYVRHHHLVNGEKTALQMRTLQACGIKIGGLAGLYCHFLGLSHAWLEEGAVSGWLIPSEFMDVNYGQAVKRYLLERVTLLHIHRFNPNDVQFADALVSSAVVWFRNAPPPQNHTVRFTFGGTLKAPALSKLISATALAHERKWTRFPTAGVRQNSGVPTIADFFKTKRGLATGHNGYFILSAEELAERELPRQCFRPILPSPRYITTDEIEADSEGNPCLERRLFLLDPDYDEDEIRNLFPTLWAYLEEGKAQKLHERYLCRHRARWYAQEDRPPPPIVCTYMGRGDAKSGRPFRFILNNSNATVANVYLAMYPTPILSRALSRDPALIRRVWKILNDIRLDQLLDEGRVYGGGLHKLEPKELANVPVPAIADLLPKEYRPTSQTEMFKDIAAE
jgi:adenine-specific DNA-methyltransferase